MYVLGIWDGHDAGATLIEGNEIKAAVNEERLTRRKLDVGFPNESIKTCLKMEGIKPDQIRHVVISTSDWVKTFTRLFPSLKRNYYRFRRRLSEKPHSKDLRYWIKYKTASLKPNFIGKKITKRTVRKNLEKLGFEAPEIHIIDHHLAHAAGASYCSPFKKALCITLDGVGDGLSGTINIYKNGEIEKIKEIEARDSLGFFYEQATNLAGFRELEDEGKLMALADFAFPVPDEKNELLDFFKVEGLNVKAKYPPTKMYSKLKDVLWHNPREQFAWMLQETLERKLKKLFTNAIQETGINNVCWSGGIAANIKANMQIRLLPEVKKWFVFPHMGDGGLALGSALFINSKLTGKRNYNFDVYLGPKYSNEKIEESLRKHKNKLTYTEETDIAGKVGDLLSEEKIVLWFQNRMEYGPRALGSRDILAPSYSTECKDKLNMKIKKRLWYQPFCPSILEEEAKKLLKDYDYPDLYMIMGFMARKNVKDELEAVINIDGSCRPQMVLKTQTIEKYRKMLEQVKKNTGNGAVLNTSFNIHGDPIVNSPQDAIQTMIRSKAKRMAIGDYLVKLK